MNFKAKYLEIKKYININMSWNHLNFNMSRLLFKVHILVDKMENIN